MTEGTPVHRTSSGDVAGIVSNKIAGDLDLAISAARRGYDMACRLGDPGLIGITR